MKSFREFIVEGSRGQRRQRRKLVSHAKKMERGSEKALAALLRRTEFAGNPEMQNLYTHRAADALEGATDQMDAIHAITPTYLSRLERSLAAADKEPNQTNPTAYTAKLALKKMANWTAKLGGRMVEPKDKFTVPEGGVMNIQADIEARDKILDSIENAKRHKKAADLLMRMSGE